MSGPYDDILHLPHPVSSRHVPMSRADRAAQFSPFAALTGYDAAIEETGRLTDPETEPDEQDKLLLGKQLQQLSDHLKEQPVVDVTYFIPDERKEGGRLAHRSGTVRRVDSCLRVLELTDGTKIPFSALRELSSSLFYRLAAAENEQ
ncbi:MAG: hypothetical protein IJP11_01555 [Oscillospiraceae bacterium]|nr:hypothetical protein [Oscillospiraceae bacterium]